MLQIKKDLYNILIQMICLGTLIAIGCARGFSGPIGAATGVMIFVVLICFFIIVDRINIQKRRVVGLEQSFKIQHQITIALNKKINELERKE